MTYNIYLFVYKHKIKSNQTNELATINICASTSWKVLKARGGIKEHNSHHAQRRSVSQFPSHMLNKL